MRVLGVVCIGTILTLELSASHEGYASSAASGLVQRLQEPHHVYARPLETVCT